MTILRRYDPRGLRTRRQARHHYLDLYHHAPTRTDEQQDVILHATQELCRTAGEPFEVIAAYEGLELALGDEEGA